MFIFKNLINLDIKKICVLIFCLSLVARLTWFFLKAKNLPITDPAGGDAIGYDLLATNLLKYHEYCFEYGKPTAYREPFYPYFLAGIYALFGHSYNIVRIIQILLSCFTCILIFLLADKLFNRKVALLSGLISSFYPYLIFYSTAILKETLFTFLLILNIYFFCKENLNNKFYNTVFAGIFAGLTALTNSVYLLFVIFTFLFFLISKKFKQAIILIIIFILIYSLWIIRNYKVFNTFIWGANVSGSTLYIHSVIPYEILATDKNIKFQENDIYLKKAKNMDEISGTKFLIKTTKEIILANPGEFLNRTVKRFLKLYRFFPHKDKGYIHSEKLMIITSLCSYGLLFPFFIYGFFRNLKDFKKYIFLYMTIFTFTFVYSITWAIIRYRIPLEPYIIIFASYGIMNIFEVIKNAKTQYSYSCL